MPFVSMWIMQVFIYTSVRINIGSTAYVEITKQEQMMYSSYSDKNTLVDPFAMHVASYI